MFSHITYEGEKFSVSSMFWDLQDYSNKDYIPF